MVSLLQHMRTCTQAKTGTHSHLVNELLDPDNFVDHLREVPADEWAGLVSMTSTLKVGLQA